MENTVRGVTVDRFSRSIEIRRCAMRDVGVGVDFYGRNLQLSDSMEARWR